MATCGKCRMNEAGYCVYLSLSVSDNEPADECDFTELQKLREKVKQLESEQGKVYSFCLRCKQRFEDEGIPGGKITLGEMVYAINRLADTLQAAMPGVEVKPSPKPRTQKELQDLILKTISLLEAHGVIQS